MSADIVDYVRIWSGRRWRWGEADCCQFARGWVIRAAGWDPLADLPRYRTEDEADALIASRGGLAAWLADLARVGPLPDVCLITLETGQECAGLSRDRVAWLFSPFGIRVFSVGSPIVVVEQVVGG